MAGAPPWLAHRGDLDDRARYAAMTPEERLACLVDVCELGDAMLAERPDRETLLSSEEPMPAAAEQTWRRLIRERRDARSAD